MYYYKSFILFIFILTGFLAVAQDPAQDQINAPQLPDTTIFEGEMPLPDTIDAEAKEPIIQDSITISQPGDTGDIETTINYTAEDSFFFDYQHRIIKLYGNATVTYGDISLNAAEIEMDWNTNTVTANGRVDSTGRLVGKPVFKEGQETYETVSMSYNFNTKKAIIRGAVTQQGEAYMHAGRIKKDADDVIYGEGMIYTTCNLPEPHFHIQASKFKKLPKGNTLVGPFHLRVNDIPTPVGFIFGMFPNKRERSSGIVIPSYGEERRRGFYLRDGGYYFSISEYMDLKLLGEIFSKGSYGMQMQSNYLKRYTYDGNLRFQLNNQRLVAESGDTTISTETWVTWSHRSASLRNSRISADVNMGSKSYNNNNYSFDMNRNMQQEFNSAVTYNRTFRGTPFSFGTSIRFNQNVANGRASLIFPDISLNMNRIYPLKSLPGKSTAWYKKIYLGQNFSYRRTITNEVRLQSESGQDSATIYPSFWSNFSDHWRRAQSDQSQAQPLSFDIPLSTSFNVFKFFNLSPNITHTEQYFFNANTYSYNEERDRFVAEDPKGGFYRAFRTSFGGRLATNIYGFYNPKLSGIQRIRHMMTPSIDFRYTPDLTKRIFGYYRDYTIHREAGDTVAYLQRLPGGGRASGALTFDLSNNVEMKVLTKKDTTGQARKVALIENFSVSTTYDYLRDSFQLQNIRFSGRTSIWQRKVSLSIGGNIDPYTYVPGEGRNQVKIERFAWMNGQGLGRLTNGFVDVSGSFSGKKGGGVASSPAQQPGMVIDPNEILDEQQETELAFIRTNPNEYVDFNIPWSLSFGYNMRYTRTIQERRDYIQSVRFNGDLSLSEQWKIRFSTNYDINQKEFINTMINIDRDLHCWQMSFSWIPFGRFTSYNVMIRAKSSLLQDLKLTKRRSYYDRF